MADVVQFQARSRPRISYEPPDEVIERFHESKALVRLVKGPRGSGKSGASIMEGMNGAHKQVPNHEGKRRTRFLVLRDTYRQLETTTIPSFKKWLGHASRLSGQYPIKGFTRMPLSDGTAIEMETVFLAMDGENIIDNLQSFEASFAWVNEARAIQDQKIVNMVISSCGRFPSKDEEGCTSRFVVLDSNPPDEMHWWYKNAQKGHTPEGWEFFDQVAPLIYRNTTTPIFYPIKDFYIPNPAATYARIQNAGYDYWLDLIPGADDSFIRTMVMGLYGTMVMGKPVYHQFWNEECASPTPIEWHQSLPIVIGIDTSGLHPGAVFVQASGGQVKVLRELHAKDTPFDTFVESILLPFIAQWFRLNPLIACIDPSNPRSGVGGKTALRILHENGISAQLAGSNRLNVRLGSVTKLLQRRGAIIVDPSCPLLLSGFRGKYHFAKIESSMVEAYKPTPEKDEFADVHDALQYACLFFAMGSSQDKNPVPQVRRRMV